MEKVWRSPQATAALNGPVQTRILERVEARDL